MRRAVRGPGLVATVVLLTLALTGCGGGASSAYDQAVTQFSHSFSKNFRYGFARCSATSESDGDCAPVGVPAALAHDGAAPAAYVNADGYQEGCLHAGYVWTCYLPTNLTTVVTRFLLHTPAQQRHVTMTQCAAGIQSSGTCSSAAQLARELRGAQPRVTAGVVRIDGGGRTVCHRAADQWSCFALGGNWAQTTVVVVPAGGVQV